MKRGVNVLTVKEKDGDNNKGSILNRNNVYYVNVSLRKQIFMKGFVYIPKDPSTGNIVKMNDNFTVLDTIISCCPFIPTSKNLIVCHKINGYNYINILKEKVPEHLFFAEKDVLELLPNHGYYIKV